MHRRPLYSTLVEPFNRKLRDECINEHDFTSLTEARRIVESWRIDYNTIRLHSSLGGLPPSVFASRPLTRGYLKPDRAYRRRENGEQFSRSWGNPPKNNIKTGPLLQCHVSV
jgi:hypothetical protein